LRAAPQVRGIQQLGNACAAEHRPGKAGDDTAAVTHQLGRFGHQRLHRAEISTGCSLGEAAQQFLVHVLRDVVARTLLPELLACAMHDLPASGFRLVQCARDHRIILIEHIVQQESRTRIRGQPFQHTKEGDRQIAGGFQHVLGRDGVIGQQRLGQPHAHIVFARMPCQAQAINGATGGGRHQPGFRILDL